MTQSSILSSTCQHRVEGRRAKRAAPPALGSYFVLAIVLAAPAVAPAQDPAPAEQAPAAAEQPVGVRLALGQEQVAARWKRFEEVLLRVAELTAKTDSDRAALLREAVAESKERLVGMQFQELVKLLRSDKLSGALKGQQDLVKDLQELLELLLSEDRAQRLADEQARIRAYLKDLNRLIKDEKAIQGATEGAGDPQELAKRQAQTAEKTAGLAKKMRSESQSGQPGAGPQQPGEEKSGDDTQGDAGEKPADEQPTDKPTEEQPGEDAKPGEDKSGNQQPGESGQPPQGQPQDGHPQEGQPQQGQPQEGQPQEGQPQQGEPQQGSPSEGDQQQQDSTDPAQKRLEAAQQRMKAAQEQLEKARKRSAAEAEEAAIHELEQAKAELEEILRQLREEEMKRVLTMLEERFRKMLQAQTIVYEGTLRLDGVPAAERGRDDEIESGRLASRQSEIVLEADKALALLGDDGTAVAMPEALRQAREDMQQVAGLLQKYQVDLLTQGIEEDIIAALEEMIAVLQKELAELEEGQQQQQPPQQGEPQEPPLVDQLAELKMIRALQMRVNKRTERYTKMIEGEQAVQPELLDALRDLARRQERIHRATRDIVTGRNQ